MAGLCSKSCDEYREILESNLEEYGRLSRTVEILLFLARAENTGIPLRTTRLDGRAELEAVCSYHEALAEEKGVRLVCQGQGVLYADAQLFKRVLSNLLLNALQHTPHGGEIRLSLDSADDGFSKRQRARHRLRYRGGTPAQAVRPVLPRRSCSLGGRNRAGSRDRQIHHGSAWRISGH